LHGPGEELAAPEPGQLAIDVPGHGQSTDFTDMGAAVRRAATELSASEICWPDAPAGAPDRLYPDMTPDRFGSYLQRAWAAARAEVFFSPWYEASAAHAIPLDEAKLEPHALQCRALARIRSGSAARRWHETLLSLNGAA